MTIQELDAVALLEQPVDVMATEKPLSFWRIAVIRLRRDRLTMVALFVLAIIAGLALGADVINERVLNVDPEKTAILESLEGPSAAHWLGTDDVGRDQLARLLIGGRVSLAIAFVGTLVTLVLGVTIGMIAAYFGKWVDDFVMWLINTLSAIPGLFLLLILGSLFEISPAILTILLGALGWFFISRLVRSTVFSIRERDYVTAARALGSSDLSIMGRHILPNVIPIVIIATMRTVGNLILVESALSFLGFGVQPPTATWGNMLTKALKFIIIPDGRHLVIVPGVMITLTVLCLFIIGDGLRDALDPRLS